MSGNYYKVTPEPEKAKFIGFKKASQAEVKDIVSRLTKPAYITEHRKTINYSVMPSASLPVPPSVCSRSTHGHLPEYLCDTRKLTDRELQKMLRRIQKPTRAYLLSRNYERNDRELNSAPPCVPARPSTAYERGKAFQHLCRPTTASRGKHATECHLCLDDERELNKTLVPFEYSYANDRTVTKEEVNCIVSRLLLTSTGETTTCSRVFPDYSTLYVQSVRLPLVSGLPRSKSVADICNRLYTNKGERGKRNYHGYSTQPTQITNYPSIHHVPCR